MRKPSSGREAPTAGARTTDAHDGCRRRRRRWLRTAGAGHSVAAGLKVHSYAFCITRATFGRSSRPKYSEFFHLSPSL